MSGVNETVWLFSLFSTVSIFVENQINCHSCIHVIVEIFKYSAQSHKVDEIFNSKAINFKNKKLYKLYFLFIFIELDPEHHYINAERGTLTIYIHSYSASGACIIEWNTTVRIFECSDVKFNNLKLFVCLSALSRSLPKIYYRAQSNLSTLVCGTTLYFIHRFSVLFVWISYCLTASSRDSQERSIYIFWMHFLLHTWDDVERICRLKRCKAYATTRLHSFSIDSRRSCEVFVETLYFIVSRKEKERTHRTVNFAVALGIVVCSFDRNIQHKQMYFNEMKCIFVVAVTQINCNKRIKQQLKQTHWKRAKALSNCFFCMHCNYFQATNIFMSLFSGLYTHTFVSCRLAGRLFTCFLCKGDDIMSTSLRRREQTRNKVKHKVKPILIDVIFVLICVYCFNEIGNHRTSWVKRF